uniref:Putative DNA binding, helix-turn-helix domain containing protein n=1 Tax=viral metagenome TaxID=1070528 RepID=A0A6H1ZI42_9ZZZZ
MKGKLKKACKEKGITLYRVAKDSKVSISQLYLINQTPTLNVGANVILKIFKSSGLKPKDYLDNEAFE